MPVTDGNGAEDARECPSSLWAEGSHQERKAPGMLICLFSVPSPSYMLPRQCNIYSTQQFAAVSRCVDRPIGGGKPGCGDLPLRCPTSVTAAGAPIHDSDGQNHALCHSLVPDWHGSCRLLLPTACVLSGAAPSLAQNGAGTTDTSKIFSGSATRHRAEQHRRQSTAGSHCPSLWSGVQDCWARIATLGMRSGGRPVAPCIPDHQMAQPPSAPRGRLRSLCNWSICELSLCLAEGPLGFPVHLGRRDHRFGAGTVTGLGAAATLGFSWTLSARTQSVETSMFSKRVSPALLALFVPSVRPYLLPQPIYSPCCSRLLCSVDLFSSPFRSQPAPVF